ncbi:MAG: KH domain-containing protein [Raoultibacter sp.]|jgi:predicted RNA-binding protein YlqC (UPF0109 family)
MADETVDIVGLITTIVEPLIEFKDELEISSSEASDGSLLVEIRVHEDDAGKVIGRQGRVIKAVRTLSRAAGSRVGTHVEVELID